MIFTETKLKGAFIIEIRKLEDDRGFFGRSWCRREMEEHGLTGNVVNMNTSLSKFNGTLRGLHFQLPPNAEAKMIRCAKGSVFDIIVDLRPGSPTFRQWFGEVLTADNYKMLYSPEGFAQGFITLEDNSEITYLTTDFYAPGAAKGVRWNDPAFDIEMPFEPAVISDQDKSWPDFDPSYFINL